jgi:hypothetical protein
MLAVWQKWQRFREDHGVERQSEINMWIRHAVAESFCVDRDKQQIVLAAEIFRGGRFGLVRGRKMNVTVGDIDRRAVILVWSLGDLLAIGCSRSCLFQILTHLKRLFGADTCLPLTQRF